MYFLAPKSFNILVTDPTGRIALAGSFVLVVLGLFLSGRISKIDV